MPMAVQGGEALQAALKAASASMRRDGMVKALQPSAMDVARRAQQLAPRNTGRMASSIFAEIAETDDQHVDILVGPADRFFYARFAEFGSAPHEIGRKLKRRIARVFKTHGPEAARRELREIGAVAIHPGTTAQPFLRPALDELKETVVADTGARMAKQLEAAFALHAPVES